MKIALRFSFLASQKENWLCMYFAWWRSLARSMCNSFLMCRQWDEPQSLEINHKLHTQTKSIARMPWHLWYDFYSIYHFYFSFKMYRVSFLIEAASTRKCVIWFSHMFFLFHFLPPVRPSGAIFYVFFWGSWTGLLRCSECFFWKIDVVRATAIRGICHMDGQTLDPRRFQGALSLRRSSLCRWGNFSCIPFSKKKPSTFKIAWHFFIYDEQMFWKKEAKINGF